MKAQPTSKSKRVRTAFTSRLLRALQDPHIISWAELVEAGGQSSKCTRDALSAHLNALMIEGRESDRPFVERLVGVVQGEEALEPIALLVESILFYDQVGDAARGLAVALIGVRQAGKVGNLNLIRKVSSIAGISYSRVCDFENSFIHLEKALLIARSMKSIVYEFAALCNVVSVLQTMGLFTEAKLLALQLLTYPSGAGDLDHLHLQNCINGLYVARRTSDASASEQFLVVAREKVAATEAVSTQWRSYVSAEFAMLLIKRGEGRRAFSILEKCSHNIEQQSNLRVDVILSCARAACAIANNDVEEMHVCVKGLADLADRTTNYALHHEDVLRSLVDLAVSKNLAMGEEDVLAYQERLNMHIINVKHRRFFSKLGESKSDRDAKEVPISFPTYHLPTTVRALITERGALSESLNSLSVVDIFDQVVFPPAHGTVATRKVIEERLRTKKYDCALDWAVAADFNTERVGQHCLQVGFLAGVLASDMNYSEIESVTIEMAIRLHDIGKLFVEGATHSALNRGEIPEYSVIYRHTQAGSALLGSVAEPVFQLASQIALQHHEWWNGGGFPRGLGGADICIEARICAVADVFVKFANSSSLHSAWDVDAVGRQVATMSGTQFDPDVVLSLLNLLNRGLLTDACVGQSRSTGKRRLRRSTSMGADVISIATN